MEHDVDALKNLLSNYDKHVSDEKEKAQKELDKKLSTVKSNSVKPLSEDDINNVKNNFWKQKQSVLEAHKESLGKVMLEGVGESREELVKLIHENSESNEKDNSLPPEFNKMAAYEERMKKFRENKKSIPRERGL